MSELKVYKKRGNTNYKEKKLIKAIREKAEQLKKANPEFTIEPVSSFEDLKQLHESMIAEPVTYEEFEEAINNNNESNQTMSEDNEKIEDVEPIEETKTESASSGREYVDPFNRDEPIVRDYVLGNDYEDDVVNDDDAPPQTFDEPKSEKEAFEMPSTDEEDEESKDSSSSDSSSSEKKSEPRQRPKPNDEPLNPDFDTMSPKKQKRSTKRFAKHIVGAVCTLLEKGFVWFANKDINEGKLAEYELSGEVDLSLLLQLEGGQEATVKQFFQMQCKQAEELSKINEEDKQDLIDALAEVLMEKGVAPTPTQELLMVGLSVIGGQAILLMGLKQQTNAVLNQLKAMNEGSYDDYEPDAEYSQEEYETAESDTPPAQDHAQPEPQAQPEAEVMDAPVEESELLLGDGEVKTKE